MAKSTKELANWTMEDFSNYFSGSKHVFGENGSEFQTITELAGGLNDLEDQPISYDMLNDRQKKIDELLNVTLQYGTTHANPHTPKGKERRAVVDAFMNFCRKERDEMEAIPNPMYFEGKTIDQMKNGVDYLEIKQLEDAMEESRSKKMTEDEVIKYTNTMSKYVQAVENYQKNPQEIPLATEDMKKNINDRLQNNLERYKSCLDSMRDLRNVRRIIDKSDLPNQEKWDELLTLKEATAEMTGREDTVGSNSNRRYKFNHNGKRGFFTQDLKGTTDTFIDNVLDEYVQKNDRTREELLIIKNADLMRKIANADVNNVSMKELDIEIESFMKNLDIEDEYRESKYQDLQELLKNSSAKEKMIEIWKKNTSISAVRSQARIKEDRDGVELSNRNVATSRMAELLGVGNLVVHTEKMTVTVDGKEVSGCFMEHAEGIDLAKTENEEELKQLNETVFEVGGGLAKDSSNLYLFDIICGQMDRNGGNFFVKLGEPEADGKRRVIGVQGIDNDAAFARGMRLNTGMGGALDKIIFVDDAFAKKLDTLNREKVKYAVGDILNSVEIDSIMTRIEKVKEHINTNAIKLSDNEWNLDRYANKDISTLAPEEQKNAQKYIDAIKEIEYCAQIDSKVVTSAVTYHYDGKVGTGLNGAKKRYEKMMQAKDPEKASRAELANKVIAEKSGTEKKQKEISERPKERVDAKEFLGEGTFKRAKARQVQSEKKAFTIGAKRDMGKR